MVERLTGWLKQLAGTADSDWQLMYLEILTVMRWCHGDTMAGDRVTGDTTVLDGVTVDTTAGDEWCLVTDRFRETGAD